MATVTRTCPICQKPYEADIGRLRHKRHTTCSRECSYVFRGRKTGKGRTTRPCEACGKPLELAPWQVRAGVRFCSRLCSHGERTVRPCENCGVEMNLAPWQMRAGQRFCSKPCGYAGRECKATFPAGTAHPSYVDGKAGTGYPPEFNSALKRRIRERDGHYCQLCGMTEQEHLEKWRQVLTVNHIDFDKTNCADDNLNTLCTRCNTQINFDRERWTAYFQEAMLCG